MKVASLAAVLAILVLVPAAHSGSAAPFVVGLADLLPEQNAAAVAPAVELGATAFRYTLQWAPGERALTPSDASSLHSGVGAAPSMRIVLSVYGTTSTAPVDAAARSDYCAFVADALRLEPRIRDVVIWNEPNKAQFWSPQANAPAAYEALLATCHDTLHAAAPGVNVLALALSHDGNDDARGTSPGAFIRAVMFQSIARTSSPACGARSTTRARTRSRRRSR